MEAKEQIDHFRQKLRDRMNTVPASVTNGSIQSTRVWMDNRKRAEKLLKKPRVTIAELMAAISSLE